MQPFLLIKPIGRLGVSLFNLMRVSILGLLIALYSFNTKM